MILVKKLTVVKIFQFSISFVSKKNASSQQQPTSPIYGFISIAKKIMVSVMMLAARLVTF